MAGGPAGEVRLDEFLHVVAEAFTDLEHGFEFFSAGLTHVSTLIQSAGDLVEVSSDCAELGDSRSEGEQFLFRKGWECAQVGSGEDGNIRGLGEAAGSGALVKELAVVRREANGNASAARGSLTGNCGFRRGFRCRAQGHVDDTSQPSGLAEELATRGIGDQAFGL